MSGDEMRVLVACEESQVVTKAFRALGHTAFSCDIEPCSGGHPEWHIQADALEIIKMDWDLVIAHPPCTYLCVPGAHYLHKQQDRWGKMVEAKIFFMEFTKLRCKWAIENPLPHKYAELPKYTQIINPWQFGHEVKKRTCLWLNGLPKLKPTKIVSKGDSYRRANGSMSNSIWYAKANSKERSKTFPGIAMAMAEQWGGHQ